MSNEDNILTTQGKIDMNGQALSTKIIDYS